MNFPNKAGDHADSDAILSAELKAAGIPFEIHDLLRKSSGEVKSGVIGMLHGWTFRRAWYYWMCEGPGIPMTEAEKLHAEYGKEVRVNGDCTCSSPREMFKGLACGSYHVDTPRGLKALADMIKEIVRVATGSEMPIGNVGAEGSTNG